MAAGGLGLSRDRSGAYAWWATLLLTLGITLAFMDRAIVNLFVIPIQRDMHVSDTEISLLIGFAFAFFNALAGLPVARWVDATNRRLICAVGVAAWTIASIASGLTANYMQLFLARIGVGVGEAAVTPSGVSLIADHFGSSRRGIPMGLFYGGIYLGGGLSFLLGGFLWNRLGDRLIAVPLLGELHSWQVILIAVGSLGLIVAPLMLTMREPQRRDGNVVLAQAGLPLREVARYFWTNGRAVFCINAGFCMLNFVLYAASSWLPTLLVRDQGWSLAKAGQTLGTMTLLLGPLSGLIAGALADLLVRNGRADGKLLIGILAAVGCGIAGIVFALTSQPAIVFAALLCIAFFGPFSLPLAPGALQDIMPNAMRGQATALYVFLTNTIAGGLGATSVALLTDFVFHDRSKLNVALGIVSTTASLAAVALLLSGLAPLRKIAKQLVPVDTSGKAQLSRHLPSRE